MILLPQKKEFKKWFDIVPVGGDIVFFKTKAEAEPFKEIGVPLYSKDEAVEQGPDLFELNVRSWYGYSLSNSAFCAKLPQGHIEALDKNLYKKLLAAQVKIKVPTILKSDRGNKITWVTSHSWAQSDSDEKHSRMECYYLQHPRVEKYKTVPFSELPAGSKKVLRELNLKHLVNTFTHRSGPNCFAAVAHAVSSSKSAVSDVWLHWPPLSRFLTQEQYKQVNATPEAGDVLIFAQRDQPVHGCIYLGHGLVFEKPGQDFYEPYVISKLKKSQKDWSNSALQVWRRL
jgi:hypothetical protein